MIIHSFISKRFNVSPVWKTLTLYLHTLFGHLLGKSYIKTSNIHPCFKIKLHTFHSLNSKTSLTVTCYWTQVNVSLQKLLLTTYSIYYQIVQFSPINIKKLHIEDCFLVKSTTYPSGPGEKYKFVIDV